MLRLDKGERICNDFVCVCMLLVLPIHYGVSSLKQVLLLFVSNSIYGRKTPIKCHHEKKEQC